jgi:hypothetical protein
MDLDILKKKLSSFKTPKGVLTKVNDELLLEILQAWEQWTGPARNFYTAIGTNPKKFAKMLGRAKQLKRDGHAVDSFQEISVQGADEMVTSLSCDIELQENNKIIRFRKVDLLIEYLKKVA